MNERVLLVHVCTDPSLHSIMVERFAIVDVAGLGAGTEFWYESWTLDRCEIVKLSQNIPQALSYLAAANGILSPGNTFRERYSIGALFSWCSLFFRSGQLFSIHC